MSIADEIQKLDGLRQTGALTDDEFALAKAKLLNGSAEAHSVWAPSPDAADI